MSKKRSFAVIFLMVFTLLICTSAFAATSFDGLLMPTVWDSVAGKTVNMPGVTKISGGMAGKDTDDSFYYLDTACTNLNTGLYNLGAGNTLECQFMLKDDSSALVLRANLYFTNNKANGNDATNYNRLVVDSNGIRYYGGRWSSGANTLKWDVPYKIVPGRWYTLVAEYEDKSANEGEQNGKFYINGNLLKEDTSLGTYGFRHLAIGATDGAHGVYLDNVVCSNSRGAGSAETHVSDAEKLKVSYITSIANVAEIANDEGLVKLASSMTVGNIKDTIITTGGSDDVVTIYNPDMSSVAADGDNAIGKIIVIASKKGTNSAQAYNYYSVVGDKYVTEIIALKDGVAAENFYDNKSELSFGAVFNSYNDGEYNPLLCVALYRGGVLEKLWTDKASLNQAVTNANLAVDLSDMPSERTGTSIKVMLVDGETMCPYQDARAFRFGYADTPATLYIIGDSIAQTYDINAPGETTLSKSPFIQGWGYHIASYLNNKITVDNRARSGWDTDRFLYPDGVYTKEDGVDSAGTKLNDKSGNRKIVPDSERYKCWPAIKEDIKPGDYLIIALGINDAGSAMVPDDRFEENLSVMCQEAQAMGVSVIFSTPTINGGKWTDEWSFREETAYRGSIMAKVASENGAYCLPTGATLASLYNSIYNEYSAQNPTASTLEKKQHVRSQFHRYDEVFNAPVSEGGYGYSGISGLNDQQHYADKGAKRVAGIIATLISKTDCTLSDYLVNLPGEL